MNKEDKKAEILRRRSLGHSYRQIQKETGYSKGTISYYCGQGVKERQQYRQRHYKKNRHPLIGKIQRFKELYKQPVCSNVKSSSQALANTKISNFRKIKGEGDVIMRDINTKFTLQDIIDKYGTHPRCYLTGEQVDLNNAMTYQLDHIVPRSKGGKGTLDNLGITTPRANSMKGDMLVDEYTEECIKHLKHKGLY